MKTVGIGLKAFSYTPEAYAYASYLEKFGIQVQLANEAELCGNNDVNIYFMGLRPFYRKRIGSAIEVHEYQSLSTPPYSHLKDALKRYFNRKPAGRIFLNEVVSRHLPFSDSVPFIYRDMGVDQRLFQTPDRESLYDIVYCGSITGRAGLIEQLERLARLNFSLLIIGSVSGYVKSRLSEFSNISFAGRVTREELPALFSVCKAGLNYTPDLYPFNIQTSTKTLEYLSAGLTLVSNRYQWVEDFSSINRIEVVWVDQLQSPSDLQQASNVECMTDHEWNTVLERAGFFKFLEAIYFESK